MLKMIVAASLALVAGRPGPQAMQPFSSPRNDYNLSIDGAGQLAVFARSDPDFRNARIMISSRKGGRWTEAAPISFSQGSASDSDPWLTPDGQTLYFVSDRAAPGREESRTDLDIWRARRLPGGGWSNPEHLGHEINGRGPELGPELHSGVLYFAAARRSGKGGLDVYAAPTAGAGFAAPALLDDRINSAESDSDFTISPDGRKAAFWRGTGGKATIMLSQRIAGGWSEPRVLGPRINLGAFNFTPSFSADGKRLTFASMAEGEDQADIFVASWR